MAMGKEANYTVAHRLARWCLGQGKIAKKNKNKKGACATKSITVNCIAPRHEGRTGGLNSHVSLK
jgi:hypothetical protein